MRAKDLFDIKEKKILPAKVYTFPDKTPEIEIIEDKEEIPSKFKEFFPERTIRIERRIRRRKPKKDKVYNRRWQILEFIRKNWPTTLRGMANKFNTKEQNLTYIISKLERRGMIKKEENDIFDDKRVRHVYSIGKEGKKFLERNNCKSFLWPDNPFDEGEDGKRL